MAQTYTINCYVSTHGGQSDLAIMETNFESLRSTFSGGGAPANAVAGMMWFDTAQNLLKVRNDANDAWLGVLTGTTSLKMLVYRNTAEDGWAIDSGVTDRVVAIKGGATYTTGGATAGSWTLPDYTLLEADIPAHTHDVEWAGIGGGEVRFIRGGLDDAISGTVTDAATSTGGGGSHNHGATYRPAAAVVTIQYPDI